MHVRLLVLILSVKDESWLMCMMFGAIRQPGATWLEPLFNGISGD